MGDRDEPPARGRRIRDAGWILLPAAVVVSVSAIADDGGAGRFQADLGGLVAAVLLGAFGTPRPASAALRLPAAALLAGLAHFLLGGTAGSTAALAFLYLAVSAGAGGWAALGRRVGAPDVPAGAVAAVLLFTAMAGLLWADPVAQRLPRPRRHAFRQSVLHVDPALALAYDASRFDRLHDPEIYVRVPLASSFIERPHAGPTGALWLAWGLLAWASAAALRARAAAGAHRLPSPSPWP
ncbi:MAG: hypothetical protein ACYTG6_18295 [Planctomycetota bacterium]